MLFGCMLKGSPPQPPKALVTHQVPAGGGGESWEGGRNNHSFCTKAMEGEV